MTIPLPTPHHRPTHMTQSHPHDPPTQTNKKLTRTHAIKMGDKCERPWRVEGFHHLLHGVCDAHTDLLNVGLERVTAGLLHFPAEIRHGQAISVEGRLGDVARCAVAVLSALLGEEREGVLAESLLAARILPGGASDQGTHIGVVPQAGVRRALQGLAPCPLNVRRRDVGVKGAQLNLWPALNHGLKSLSSEKIARRWGNRGQNAPSPDTNCNRIMACFNLQSIFKDGAGRKDSHCIFIRGTCAGRGALQFAWLSAKPNPRKSFQ